MKWRHRLQCATQSRNMVLMYHRVATPASDVWDIAVSPEAFEQQLRILQKTGKVIPLGELVERYSNRVFPKDSIAITFDDGYADNYLAAKPLLEKYQLPATFFVSSGHLDKLKEFWWDELEHIILLAQDLPATFRLRIAGQELSVELGHEANLSTELAEQHMSWKASSMEPMSMRSALYIKLYLLLKPLCYQQQQEVIAQLKQQAGMENCQRQAYRCMDTLQLQELASSPLFDIGIHTATHTALASHAADIQKEEILQNKKILTGITKTAPEILAYPYGSYNHDTITLASELGLKAAFTTEPKLVKKASPAYRLGRFQVNNWPAPTFEKKIKYWFTQLERA